MRRRPFTGAGDAPRKGKKTGEHKELTTNPFPAVGSSGVRPEKRIDAEQSFKHLQWQPAVAGDDSGWGEAGLGVWEGGGGAEEGSCARNRSLVAGGGRSTEGGRRRGERSSSARLWTK